MILTGVAHLRPSPSVGRTVSVSESAAGATSAGSAEEYKRPTLALKVNPLDQRAAGVAETTGNATVPAGIVGSSLSVTHVLKFATNVPGSAAEDTLTVATAPVAASTVTPADNSGARATTGAFRAGAEQHVKYTAPPLKVIILFVAAST